MHPRPRLSPYGRLVLVTRVRDEGWSVATATKASGVSRATGHKWVRRYDEEGVEGLMDRPCRPHSSPARLDPGQEGEIVRLRREQKLGPHRLAARTGNPRSTCYQVLRRHRLHRLDWVDRPTGRLIRRYEYSSPGELVHVDVKKLGRIPTGGGHRVHGRRVSRNASGGSATTTSTPWSTTTRASPTARSCATNREPPALAFYAGQGSSSSITASRSSGS